MKQKKSLHFFIRIGVLILGLLLLRIFLPFLENNTAPLQHVTATAVCAAQNLFGVSCSVTENTILYQEFQVVINFLCLGIDQMLLISLLALSYAGRQALPLIVRGVACVFALNTLRLLSFYYVAVLIGFQRAYDIHAFMYMYGQGILIIVMFIILVNMTEPSMSRTQEIRNHTNRKKH